MEKLQHFVLCNLYILLFDTALAQLFNTVVGSRCPGNTTSTLTANSNEECKQLCVRDPGCYAVVFSNGQSTCKIKVSCALNHNKKSISTHFKCSVSLFRAQSDSTIDTVIDGSLETCMSYSPLTQNSWGIEIKCGHITPITVHYQTCDNTATAYIAHANITRYNGCDLFSAFPCPEVNRVIGPQLCSITYSCAKPGNKLLIYNPTQPVCELTFN